MRPKLPATQLYRYSHSADSRLSSSDDMAILVEGLSTPLFVVLRDESLSSHSACIFVVHSGEFEKLPLNDTVVALFK